MKPTAKCSEGEKGKIIKKEEKTLNQPEMYNFYNKKGS